MEEKPLPGTLRENRKGIYKAFVHLVMLLHRRNNLTGYSSESCNDPSKLAASKTISHKQIKRSCKIFGIADSNVERRKN